MAMQPVGHIVGCRSRYGFISTIMAVPISIYIDGLLLKQRCPCLLVFQYALSVNSLLIYLKIDEKRGSRSGSRKTQ
jgi:hypothetical protein